MNASFQLSALGTKTKALLGFVLLLAALLALFDWNWFRRPLERYLSEKSSREIRIEDLRVTLGADLEPTVRLRGLHIPNAAWGGEQPMAIVGEASFTFSLRSLWAERPVISRLVLTDADVNMERRADGLRNWRLMHPDDRSPGKTKVLTLEAHRTKLRFMHGGIDLDLLVAASPAESSASERETLPTKLAIEGIYRGARFRGEALTGAVVSFRDSGMSFPFRGRFASGRIRFDIDAALTDIFDLASVDGKVRVAGASLSELHPFVKFQPAVSRAFEVEAHVTKTGNEYRFAGLRGTIGATDIAGEASLTRDHERPMLRAALDSQSADLADLASLVGATYPARSLPKKVSTRQQSLRSKDDGTRPERIFSRRPFRAERMRAIDAHVTLYAKKLQAANVPALNSLRLTAQLKDGMLLLMPIDIGIAGGHVVGSLGFDGREQPPSSRAAIDLRNIRLERLIPSLTGAMRNVGPLKAQLRLTGQGSSIAAILGSSTGSVAASIDRGRISNLLDAKLGLNGGKILSLLLRGDRNIAFNCGVIALDFRDGSGKSRAVVLDTEQTRTHGSGSVNLREEQFDLLLTPEPKNPGLLTLRSSIRVYGALKRPEYTIEKRVELRGARSMHAPAALSAAGQAKESPCASAVGR